MESNTEEKCLKETNKKEKIHERIILKKKEKNPGVSVITEFVKVQVQNSIDDLVLTLMMMIMMMMLLMMNRIKSLDSGKISVT